MTMDTAADLSGEVGYVPLTYLAQFFGFQVAWNGVTTLRRSLARPRRRRPL